MKRIFPRLLSLISVLTVAAACSGGSGSMGASPPPPPPPPPPPTGWQPGVFQDYDTFFARCESPRSGVNPATGLPYPDVPGSTLDENNFLRSYSNDTYLWYDEITDRDPGLYDNPLDYFALLRTEAITPSGAPKDKFHFTYDSQEWYELSQGGISAGYGAQFVLLSATPPREVVVAYTEPNTPATNLDTPLARGARILKIDGFDIDDDTQAGVDALNEGLFPSDTTTPHTFEVLDLGAALSREVTMTPQLITSDPAKGEDIIATAMGDVGYLLFNDHIATAEQELINAVNYFNANGPIDELILDIRYNGGGYLAIASQFAYMIAGPVPTAGKTFELLQFNDKYPNTNPLTGATILPTPFYDTTLGPPFNGGPAGQALPTLNLSRVFVLTGSGSCSASEAIMNGLRGVDVEVIQIGSTTCGKPYGFYATDNCGTTYFTIQFRGVNAKNFGDYTDGFSPANTPANEAGTVVPGCSVGDDFENALGDPSEARLAAALDYLNGNGCPAPSGLAPRDGLGKPGAPAMPADGILPKSPWHTNRIYLP